MNSDQLGALIALLFIVGVPVLLKLMGFGAKKVLMKNLATGQIKAGYFGFSWTYLFFGFFVPLVRGELSTAALHLLFTIVTLGLWQFVIAFLYNRQYTQRLVATGFRLSDSPDKNRRAAERIGLDLERHLQTTAPR